MFENVADKEWREHVPGQEKVRDKTKIRGMGGSGGWGLVVVNLRRGCGQAGHMKMNLTKYAESHQQRPWI